MSITPTYNAGNGFLDATIWSGQVAPVLTGAPGATAVGSDVLLCSGPGRLNAIMTHQSYLALSGVNISVYDAALPVSGGPIPASGHRALFYQTAPKTIAASGDLMVAGAITVVNLPFTSGLCVNSRSGQVGATFFYTLEKPQY